MEFKDIINKRRAVNFFDPDKDVSQKLLKQVVDMAAKTPSSFNLQPWNLVVLRDQDEKRKLQKLAWDQPKVSEAPVTLIVLADMDGWKDDHKMVEKVVQEMIKAGHAKEEQRDFLSDARKQLYGADHDASLAFANKNTGFFAMTLMLAAKSVGLDTHPMDGFDREGVKKEFNIPDHFWLPLLLSVGYFKEGSELAPPKWRKTYDDIVVKF
jgi:nitroreductase